MHFSDCNEYCFLNYQSYPNEKSDTSATDCSEFGVQRSLAPSWERHAAPPPSTASVYAPLRSDEEDPSPVRKHCGAASVHLWQFLLELLLGGANSRFIQWTGNALYEFKILDPHAIAHKWGVRKNKPKMTYEKLSRGLRYYYDRKILVKTHRKKYVYRFTANIHPFLQPEEPTGNWHA